MKNSYMVFVNCITYNQAHYIKDTLDGFCMQKTSFPFVCGIIDDASTDGEQDVINNYLELHFDLGDESIVREEETDDFKLTFARHNTNLNCFFAVLRLKYNHHHINKSKSPYYAEWQNCAKFIALCEGDDYWIDPEKLQKQCSFMLSHPRCSLVTHLSYSLENGVLTPFTSHVFDSTNEYEISIEQIIENHLLFHTSSLFFYVRDFNKHYNFLLKTGIIDFLLKYLFATDGEVHILPVYMSVYRRMATGSWSMRTLTDTNSYIDHVRKSIIQLQLFNEYTGGEFLSNISNLIMKKEFEILLINNDIKLLLRPPYKCLFKSLPFKTKVGVYLRYLLCLR